MERIQVGVCGSPLYENKREIQDTIFKLKKTFGDALTIVSGGRKDGADKYVKKYAMEFGCQYKEFNPSHTKRNLYSVLPDWYFGKPYSPRNYFIRNKSLVEYVDYLIVFKEEGKTNTDIEQLIKEAIKSEKKLVVIS